MDRIFLGPSSSLKITALELAYGRPSLSNHSMSKSAFMKLNKRFRFSGYDMGEGKMNKKFSEVFEDMVGLCLDQDPLKRPSADSQKNFLSRICCKGLPNVEERFGWTFDVERFEMEPVFPTEQEEEDVVVKHVQCGEIICSGESMINSGIQSLAIGCGHSEGGYIKEVMLKGLSFLKKSLEDQKAKIMHIIASLGGGAENVVEMSREEELMKMNEQFMKELENEEMKNFALEIELDFEVPFFQ
ncbi:hypothetical protein Leryth_024774 [Lithospermum erythrorhizon]|nr:hypothetical protein Leryth_024774 [Lithospermum erythrorhizon]